jgi:hypothetical protein
MITIAPSNRSNCRNVKDKDIRAAEGMRRAMNSRARSIKEGHDKPLTLVCAVNQLLQPRPLTFEREQPRASRQRYLGVWRRGSTAGGCPDPERRLSMTVLTVLTVCRC